jgi:hypothetical protein
LYQTLKIASTNYFSKGGIMSEIKPRFEGLKFLQEYADCWCVWRPGKARGDGKIAKVPWNLKERISINNMKQWLTFAEAETLYKRGGFDGVGLLMAGSKNLICIDIDNSLDENGKVLATAKAVVDRLLHWGSYIEVSQSGRGLHCFVLGTRPAGFDVKTTLPGGHSLEVYDAKSKRYMCVTGAAWLGGAAQVGVVPVPGGDAEIAAFMTRFGLAEKDGGSDGQGGGGGQGAKDNAIPVVDDDDIVKRIEGSKDKHLTGLWNHTSEIYVEDESTGDFALACEIAKLTRNLDQIERIMRKSKAKRDKWDEHKKYLVMTIGNALEKTKSNNARSVKAGVGEDAEDKTGGLIRKGGELLIGGITDLLVNGRLRPTLLTVLELMARDRGLAGCVYFDEFKDVAWKTRSMRSALECNPEIGKLAPDKTGDIMDDDLLALKAFMEKQWSLIVKPPSVMDEALALWARSSSRNPAWDKLNSLEWDGKPRVENWLTTYCNASTRGVGDEDISRLVREIGKRFLVQSIARVFDPGCKADVMLVLEGKQGVGKSTLCRILGEAIVEDGYLDGFTLDEQNGKDAREKLRGKAVVEWSELSGLSRRETNEVKTFLSQNADTYRVPYEKRARPFKRTCVFIGTTNDDSYLQDATGNRRIWPVRVGHISTERLKADVDQLLAEAIVLFRAGSKWWIDSTETELTAMAVSEQTGRMMESVLDEKLEDLIRAVVSASMSETELGECGWKGEGYPLSGRGFVHAKGAGLHEWGDALGFNEPGKAGEMRLAGLLRRKGVEKSMRNKRKPWSVSDEKIEEVRPGFLERVREEWVGCLGGRRRKLVSPPTPGGEPTPEATLTVEPELEEALS